MRSVNTLLKPSIKSTFFYIQPIIFVDSSNKIG